MASTMTRHSDKDIQKEFENLYRKTDEIGILRDALNQLKTQLKNAEEKISELTNVIQSLGQQEG